MSRRRGPRDGRLAGQVVTLRRMPWDRPRRPPPDPADVHFRGCDDLPDDEEELAHGSTNADR